MKKYFILIVFISASILAQKENKKEPVLWRFCMGTNFGATTPVPKPKEVTKIFVWYPNINPSFSLMGIQHFKENHKGGIRFGFMIEKKGFETTTSVEKLSINVEGEKMFFSGNQKTIFDARYFGSMLAYNRNFNDKVDVYSGIFMSLLVGADFYIKLDGDGVISSPEGESSPLNEGTIVKQSFNEQVSSMDLGIFIGSDYFFTDKIGASFRFSAGLTNATKKEFYKLTRQKLHNLYGFIGVIYRF